MQTVMRGVELFKASSISEIMSTKSYNCLLSRLLSFKNAEICLLGAPKD